jgi:hypothetical protein
MFCGIPSSLVKLSTSLEGIGHVLRDRPLGVPPYQRSYAWGQEQVESFWWDLRTALDAETPDYFLGTIVYTSGNGRPATVIDGQQRLATATMLFTAIRDEFLRRGDSYRAGVVESDYVASLELRTAELTPRVTLNREDDEFFRSWVLAHPDERPNVSDGDLSASNKRLKYALERLSTLLTEQLNSVGPTWESTLLRWIDLLEYQARVIAVEVSDDADAFLIFETLNDRGLDLTVADLLKNYLFGLSRNDVTRVEAAWLSVLETLDTSATEETLTMFLRHYWSSLHGATRERELYSRLKREIRTSAAAVAFTEALDVAAPYYAGLLNGSHPVWESWPGIQPVSETFLRLGLERNRPMVLAAMEHFDREEFGRFLSAVVNWLVRGLIAGGVVEGGTAEAAFAEAATKISSGEVTKTEDVLDRLDGIVASDRQFMEEFRTARVNRTRLARYYLICLMQASSSLPTSALVADAIEDEWSLHLALPRRAQAADWPGFPDEAIGQLANRLGNQFILSRDTELPEDAVARAAAVSRTGSPWPMQIDQWSADAIDERQAQLAEIAPTAWPLLPT